MLDLPATGIFILSKPTDVTSSSLLSFGTLMLKSPEESVRVAITVPRTCTVAFGTGCCVVLLTTFPVTVRWANTAHESRRNPISMQHILFSPVFFFGISNHCFSYY